MIFEVLISSDKYADVCLLDSDIVRTFRYKHMYPVLPGTGNGRFRSFRLVDLRCTVGTVLAASPLYDVNIHGRPPQKSLIFGQTGYTDVW